MLNSMMLLNIFVLYWKYLFWVNFVQKLKIVTQAEICYKDYFESSEFNCDVKFFCFRSKMAFFSNFGPKTKNVSLSCSVLPRLTRMY